MDKQLKSTEDKAHLQQRIIELETLTSALESLPETGQRAGFFHQVLQQVDVPIFIQDNSHTFVYANPAYNKLMGLNSESIVGKTVPDLYEEPLASRLWDQENAILATGNSKEYEAEIEFQNEVKCISIRKSRLLDPKTHQAYLVGVIADITDQKRMEKLREEVDRITKHDLKGQLTSLVNIPRLLRISGDLNQKQLEMVQMLEDAGFQMLDMFNSSLNLYRMETGLYNFTPSKVDIVAIIHKAFYYLRSMMEQKNLKWSVMVDGVPVDNDLSFFIEGDEILCYSVFFNLLKNACEASSTGETIRIDMLEVGGKLIRINNNGVVPKEIRETFFEKFRTSGKRYGTGLGTYVAKLMTETMGGTIDFSTSNELGTTIFLKFRG